MRWRCEKRNAFGEKRFCERHGVHHPKNAHGRCIHGRCIHVISTQCLLPPRAPRAPPLRAPRPAARGLPPNCQLKKASPPHVASLAQRARPTTPSATHISSSTPQRATLTRTARTAPPRSRGRWGYSHRRPHSLFPFWGTTRLQAAPAALVRRKRPLGRGIAPKLQLVRTSRRASPRWRPMRRWRRSRVAQF